MRLESLRISFKDYGPHNGKYTGEACFKGEYGGMEIVLSPDISVQILKLCADAIVSNAKEVATSISANVIESIAGTLIENKGAE